MPTLSYKYRIEPNRMQAGALSGMLADFCQLYNAALQQSIEAYRRRSISLQYGNLALELKAVRRPRWPDGPSVPSNRCCVASTKRSKLSLLAGEAFLVSAPAPAIMQPNSASETASLSAKTAALASLVCRAISRSAGTVNCRASPPPRS